MPDGERRSDSEVHVLVRDLIALSALPTVWRGLEPCRVAADRAASALVVLLAGTYREGVREEPWPLVLERGRWIGEIGLRHISHGKGIRSPADRFRNDGDLGGAPVQIATSSCDLTEQKRAEGELNDRNETPEAEVSERAGVLVNVQRGHPQEVFVRLVRNAIQSMRGTMNRDPTLSSKLTMDGRVQFSVDDTGSGFATDAAQRPFEPFYITEPDGIGLSLPISRSIIEAHGGTLQTQPKPTGGPSFRFSVEAAP